MKILKAYTTYILKKEFLKTSQYIRSITPMADMKVPDEMFYQYRIVKTRIMKRGKLASFSEETKKDQ